MCLAQLQNLYFLRSNTDALHLSFVLRPPTVFLWSLILKGVGSFLSMLQGQFVLENTHPPSQSFLTLKAGCQLRVYTGSLSIQSRHSSSAADVRQPLLRHAESPVCYLCLLSHPSCPSNILSQVAAVSRLIPALSYTALYIHMPPHDKR